MVVSVGSGELLRVGDGVDVEDSSSVVVPKVAGVVGVGPSSPGVSGLG